MQARTASNAVEWYTFLRNVLGWRRASELQINIPDMSLSVRIANPFEKLEASQNEVEHADDTEEAMLKTMQEEQAMASELVRRCLAELEGAPEWADLLDSWIKDQRIGLAWKRYDRLEWVHGANERKMYGTIAMLKSHDLELRPKTHYPTTAVTRKKQKTLTEPVPVEGFLIRLTGQRGRAKRLGLLYHKQLYFASHDQYLVFSRPTKITPPPPPKLPASSNATVPGAEAVRDAIPDSWAVNPFPVKDAQIEWLLQGHSGTPETRRLHDADAADESERKGQNLLNCDGYVNLSDVVKVRKAKLGASPVDEDLEEGSDVDFDEDVDDTTRDDGATNDIDLDRTFELVMKNGLIIRLQVCLVCNLSLRNANKNARLLTRLVARNGFNISAHWPSTGSTGPQATLLCTSPHAVAISAHSTSTRRPRLTLASSPASGKSRSPSPRHNFTICVELHAVAAFT
jgi:hypothetical protein